MVTDKRLAKATVLANLFAVRKLFSATAVILLCLLMGFLPAVHAASSKSAAPASAAKSTPGLELAQTITTLTGVAISPLLGASAYGAFQWFRTEPAQRDKLPWFAQVWFWLPALVVVGAVALKDAGGVVVPTALKKPLDVAEALENKVSGLVAAGAFVPIITSVFGSDAVRQAVAGSELMASLAISGVLDLLLLPFALIAFASVWLAGHAINMLILISPFGTVDAGLKAFRTFLLGTVTVTGFTDPVVGMIWSLIIILLPRHLNVVTFAIGLLGSGRA